ncbi:putative MFS family arabinose efflux permease [Scopulibacillus darangshiensis]|uniref:Putative MFS family arabinose efflux permease n=1 Tax=Scopulibacillus darangshiensis TaxID=442528 RepID=A0A4R2NIY9_9BACL|nr:MFS transporter [Scopulibacillus darangshiensis]TCP21074.1 putative MFS family arabinose efflux permease [Scopulibacillus darangshiensis]
MKPYGLRNNETIRSVAGKSKAHFLLIVLVSVFPGFLEGFDGSLFQFGAPYVVQSIHGSPAMLGILATGYAAGIALFSMVGGFLFDKFSVKYTILLSVAVFSVFTLVSGYAGNLPLLIVARLLVGMGVGMFQPAIIAFLGDLFPEMRGRSVSIFTIIYGGGIFAAPYIISPFLPHFHVPFVVSAALSAISLVLFYLFIPKTYKKAEKHEIGFKGIFNRNIVVLSMLILFFGVTLFGYLGYYSQYLLKVLSLSPGQAAAISSMGGLGGMITAFPLGMLADKIGRKQIVRLSGFLVLIGSVGIFSVGDHIIALFIFTFIFGIGFGYAGFIAALGQDCVKGHLAGRVTGWLFLLYNLGSIIGGPVFALFIPFGFSKAGIITLGISSLLTFMLSFMIQNVSKSSIESGVSSETV